MSDIQRTSDIDSLNELFSEEIRRFSVNMGIEFRIVDFDSDSLYVKINSFKKGDYSRNDSKNERRVISRTVRNVILDKLLGEFDLENFVVSYDDSRIGVKNEEHKEKFAFSEYERGYFENQNGLLSFSQRRNLREIINRLESNY